MKHSDGSTGGGMPFIDRAPTDAETEVLRMMLSTFSDGSGSEMKEDGSTRAGWRQIERVFSFFFTGERHNEDKGVFDVIANRWSAQDEVVGISVKSKALSAGNCIFDDRRSPSLTKCDDALHLEITNASRKLWDAIHQRYAGQFTSDTFQKMEQAQEFGAIVLDTVRSWHSAVEQKLSQSAAKLNLSHSKYLTLSYSKDSKGTGAQNFVVHSFKLDFPQDVVWEFKTKKLLSGYVDICLDSNSGKKVKHKLFDWYALSGGQLKYYPLARFADFKSSVFQLDSFGKVTLVQRIRLHYPKKEKKILKKLEQFQRDLFRVI